MRHKVLTILILSASTGATAQPTPPPNYGHEFITIGHAGNRGTNAAEAPLLPASGWASIGAVNHEYRIAKTEVHASQWYEFVKAYAPYWTGSKNDPAFTSDWISWNGSAYVLQPGTENYTANMSWRVAARFVNWLHNEKSNDPQAFESGAYDTSTFGTGPTGAMTDQLKHSPGAKFWIPTIHEWTKAAYYDPNRYGVGQEGYWLHPDGQMTPLVSGHPQQGGQTNAGIPGVFPGEYNVGSYPSASSPWGLLDVSGGTAEWVETPLHTLSARYRLGSSAGEITYTASDRIDILTASNPNVSAWGLRIASLVPSPGTGVGFVALFFVVSIHRRRTNHE